MYNKIVLIDSNARRRAEISSLLTGHYFVDPLSSVEELSTFWPSSGSMLLVHDDQRDDEGGVLRAIESALEARGAWMPVIGFGQDPDLDRVTDVLHAGWLGLLSFPFGDPIALKNRIEVLLDRGQQNFEYRQRKTLARSRISSLTNRENQVFLYLSRGARSKQIASELHISPRTVEIHRANILGKLGADSTAAAIRIAVEAEDAHTMEPISLSQSPPSA